MRRNLFVSLVILVFTATLLAQFPRAGRDLNVIPEGSRVQYKTFESGILGQDLAYGLYLPPSYEGSDREYPVIFFLHGANENEKRWSTRGETDLMLDRMVAAGEIGEFIVAIPFGANSFYTNTLSGVRWEDMVITEFIPMIESENRAIGTRAGRAISGTSMGGYGALKIAMKRPDLFGSVSAHSAMLLADFESTTISPRRREVFLALFDSIFGVSESMGYWNENNPLRMARESNDLEGLKIYFDCGTEDDYGFFVGAQMLHETLEGRGIEHEFHLYPGGHGWDYTRQHTAASLQFHWGAFSG